MSSIYDKFRDITKWTEYYPFDDKYYKYPSNIIYACCKIYELYEQLCSARMSVSFYCDYENYSMLKDDALSVCSAKKYFIENALLYYNFCIDYLWQVLWLYYDNSDNRLKMPTDEKYQTLMRECNFDALLCGLTVLQEKKIVSVLVDNFTDKNPVYKWIRRRYNYLKHRATFYTPNLGLNDKETAYPIPITFCSDKDSGQVFLVSYKMPMITRENLDTEDTMRRLIEFDEIFTDVCEYLFDIIVPKSYFDNSEVSLETMLNHTKKHLEELKEYEKEHPDIALKIPCKLDIEKVENNEQIN